MYWFYKSSRAFTVLEMAIALTLMAIVMAFTLPSLVSATSGAIESDARATLDTTLTTVALNHAKNNAYKAWDTSSGDAVPPIVNVNPTVLKNLNGDLELTSSQDSSSRHSHEVSVASTYNPSDDAWVVGAAATARPVGQKESGTDDSWDTTCWMAQRVFDPSSGAVERFYFFYMSSAADAVLCSGTAASQVSSSMAVDSSSDLTVGGTWGKVMELDPVKVRQGVAF